MIKFFRKYHKWLGIVAAISLVLFSVSGIILNHRELFSSIDIDRNYLPNQYQYDNWNLAAVKGTCKIDSNRILIYGNIGIWLTDSIYADFQDFTQGFPKGIDNRKIFKIYKTTTGEIFSGSLFGLFKFNDVNKKWKKIPLELHNQRIVDITEKQDTLILLSRSYLLKSTDYKNFEKKTLPPPKNYDGKEGLFRTLWVIHSGEIYGNTGKLVVDLVAIVFIFLIITGLIIFINKYIIKKRVRKKAPITKYQKSNRWNLKWHNKTGWITIVFLIITTTTGIFLRPPFLILIAKDKIDKIPYTLLDTPNAWYDKLRSIIYNDKTDTYFIGTNSGIYYSDNNFTTELKSFSNQPPISVMGINAFKQVSPNELLVGSFEGLFLWNYQNISITDYIKKETYKKTVHRGPPIGEYLITGYTKNYKNTEIFFDYSSGAQTIGSGNKFPEMPKEISNQPISLWNLMLEVHTGRIFQFLFGIFYIFIVPVTGFMSLFILISGFIVWYKIY